jgi:hypothetical protein
LTELIVPPANIPLHGSRVIDASMLHHKTVRVIPYRNRSVGHIEVPRRPEVEEPGPLELSQDRLAGQGRLRRVPAVPRLVVPDRDEGHGVREPAPEGRLPRDPGGPPGGKVLAVSEPSLGVKVEVRQGAVRGPADPDRGSLIGPGYLPQGVQGPSRRPGRQWQVVRGAQVSGQQVPFDLQDPLIGQRRVVHQDLVGEPVGSLGGGGTRVMVDAQLVCRIGGCLTCTKDPV